MNRRRVDGLASVVGLLLASAVIIPSAHAKSIWQFSIWEDPDPPVNKTPPLTQHASRNKDLLKYQIPGIVVGYIGFVLLLFIFIGVFGRRIRQRAQRLPEQLSREMVKPMRSMMVAEKPSAWSRLTSKGSPKSSRLEKSPAQASIVSFDPAVLEADKAKLNEQMEQIYAHVMADDMDPSKTSMTHRDRELDNDTLPLSPSHTRSGSISSRSFSQRRPPQLAALPSATSDYQSVPLASPTSQRSFRALHPPPTLPLSHDYYAELQTPASATFPTTPGSLHGMAPTMPFSPLNNASDNAGGSTYSTRDRRQSNASSKSRKARSVRDLQISAPIPQDPNQLYNDPPPFSPPLRSPTPIDDNASDLDEESDAIVDTHRHRHHDDYVDGERATEAEDIIHAYGYGDLDSPRPVPSAAPQRAYGPPTIVSLPQSPRSPRMAMSPTSPHPPRPARPSASPSNAPATTTGTVDNANAPLPFRAYMAIPPPSYITSSQQQQQQQASRGAVAPTPTKTTFISPRRDRFAPMAGRIPGGLASANALSPMRTGMSAPYSPYMPFTPVTPITPHLVTRNERRARERHDRRYGGGMVTTVDEVLEESEMWGDGW